jgi:protocatechuate 3,4-dioxygenase beta subunit
MTPLKKQILSILLALGSICIATGSETQITPQENPASAEAELHGRSCEIAGTVVSGTSGNPVKRAQISVDHGYGVQTFILLTDREGRFSLPAITQGKHQFLIRKRGYVDTLLDIAACEKQETGRGESPNDNSFSLRIMPLAVISGRITDEAGVPVVEAVVRAQQFRGGRWFGDATATTNDLGMYRLYGLQPGAYYVSAAPELDSENGEFVTGDSVTDYVTTFYPQARDARSATVITVDAGYSAAGIDIQLSKTLGKNSPTLLPVAATSASTPGEKEEAGLTDEPASFPSHRLAEEFTTATANSRAGQAAVGGLVVNEVSGEPVRHAKVTLRSSRGGVAVAYSARTDTTGHFWITGIDPGTYVTVVDRAGFSPSPQMGGMPRRVPAVVSLRPKSEMRDLNLLLSPSSVITGRVLDQEGDPAPNFQVQAMRYSYLRGKRRLQLLASSETNDLGEYRLYGLDPGEYYIVARTTELGQEIQSPGGVLHHYIATYFPSASELGGATPIAVGEGSQLAGVDISSVAPTLVDIRGRVSCSSGLLSPDTVVALASRSSDAEVSTTATSGVNAKGEFRFRAVASGQYTISATFTDQHTEYGAVQGIDVGNSSIENLQLVLNKAMAVNGTVESDADRPLDFKSLRILLEPESDLPTGSLVGDVKGDGTFLVSGALPLRYTLQIFGLPEGYYVRKIRMGMEEVAGRKIDFSRFAGSLYLEISSSGGIITGSVLDHEQQAVSGIEVALVPDPADPDAPDLYKLVRSDESGHYTIQGIAPGNYQLFAIDGIGGEAYQDPDFIQSIENNGQSVSFQENSRVTLTLRSLSP